MTAYHYTEDRALDSEASGTGNVRSSALFSEILDQYLNSQATDERKNYTKETIYFY